MHTLRANWRKLAWLLPVAIVVAAAAFFFAGSVTERDGASATGGPSTSGVSCADVWLAELQNLVGVGSPPKPTTIGNPPPLGGLALHSAIALSRTFHDTGPHSVNTVTQTANLAIPGVIAGNAASLVLCARVDKEVADVTGVTGPSGSNPNQTFDLGITATGGNPPEVGMLVYWNSSDAARRGFYEVTATDGSTTATVLKTLAALCNTPPANGDANGALFSCIPDNKAWSTEPFSYGNSQTTTSPSLLTGATEPRAPGGFACSGPPACTTIYDKGTDTSISIGCSPSTAPGPNNWTRLETRTVVSGSTSQKVPSFGVTQFYTPVTDKTCVNNASTQRSTTYNVVWSLDSAELDGPDPATDGWDSDWDKDGCLDWEELNANQPVSKAAGGGGRDAFNPYDCGRIDGAWDVTIEADPISTSDGGNTITPGSFFRCRAAISGTSMPIYCYRDDPTLDINIQAAPGINGDGLSGSIWPTGTDGLPPAPAGPYGDVNSSHDVWTTTYTNGSDSLALSGCLQDIDGVNPEGYVYVETSMDVNVASGYGEADVWTNQTQGNCNAGTPAGGPTYNDVAIYIGTQADATYDNDYDQDLDGCSNLAELGNNPATGGLRDPFNRYDYYDVSQPRDGVIDLANDILGVILNFAPGGYPPGDENWDRPAPMSGNAGAWSRGVPDGVIDLPNDILGVILQFNPGGC